MSTEPKWLTELENTAFAAKRDKHEFMIIEVTYALAFCMLIRGMGESLQDEIEDHPDKNCDCWKHQMLWFYNRGPGDK